jgi:RNA polymerase sigma-70 factor (ECF subfamily)
MNEQLDTETLEAFVKGRPTGFNAIFNLYHTQICYFCEKITGSREEGEDIAAHTFSKLFKMHDRFNTLTNIKAFLFITARNNCFDYLRSLQRKRTHEKQLSEHLEEKMVDNKIIESIIIKEIYEAIEQLPGECRRVFKLLYVYGMRPAEIAQELSITQSTVRNHKKRALELLRISLLGNEYAITWLIFLSALELDLLLQ